MLVDLLVAGAKVMRCLENEVGILIINNAIRNIIPCMWSSIP